MRTLQKGQVKSLYVLSRKLPNLAIVNLRGVNQIQMSLRLHQLTFVRKKQQLNSLA